MTLRKAATIVYDGDGNRVSETVGSTTTKYLVDTLNPTGYSQVMDEVVNGSVTRTYAYGLSRISEDQLVSSTWTPSYYGYDGHMNVRFLSNSPGAVTDTYQFDAFGNQIANIGTTVNSYLFSAERFDQNISLYHLRARYYNVLTGRFETIDPVFGNTRDPRTLHKYTYARNDPANATDPTGQDVVVEVAFLYARNNFGVLAVARVKFDPWELAKGTVDTKTAYDSAHFARTLAYCEVGTFKNIAAVRNDLNGGLQRTMEMFQGRRHLLDKGDLLREAVGGNT